MADGSVLRSAASSSTKPLGGPLLRVVFVQEHLLWIDKIPEFKVALRKVGWKGYFTPAIPGPGGGASCGAAVLVRLFVDTWTLDHLPLDVPGRACFCCARFRGLGTLELVSCYFDVRGGLKANSFLIASLGARQRAHGMPTI